MKENLDKKEEKNFLDNDKEYVFEENKNLAGNFLLLSPNNTYNHFLLIGMEKKYFLSTPKM